MNQTLGYMGSMIGSMSGQLKGGSLSRSRLTRSLWFITCYFAMMTQPTLVNVSPAGCVPPHGITHPDKLDELTTALTLTSWDGPALVGYRVWLGGRIQLLSGSHRWEAVRASNLAIPVVVWDRESVEEAYGDLERWGVIMRSGDGYAR